MVGVFNIRHSTTPVRAEPALRQAQDDRKYKRTEHKSHPVRAERVEALLLLAWHSFRQAQDRREYKPSAKGMVLCLETQEKR